MAVEYLTVEHLSTKDLIRIFSKIEIMSDLQWNNSPCWIWCGARSKRKGYGIVHWIDWNYKPHRLLFAWAIHPLPKHQSKGELDHLCRRPACCNPLHLEFVSTRINVLRSNAPAALNARKTVCKRGHPLEGIRWDGRYCLICVKNRVYIPLNRQQRDRANELQRIRRAKPR